MSFTCSDSKERTGRLNIGNGDSSPHLALLKYKRRKVSAVRDFPPGCQFVVPNNLLPTKAGVCNGTDENSFSGHQGVLGNVEIPDANIALASTLRKPNTSLVLEKDGHNLVNTESILLTQDLEGKNDGVTENINFAGHETSSKDLHQMVVTSTEEMLECSILRSCSPPNYSIFVPNDKDAKKAVVRKYPPRRKVSAVRDFPPFCGLNAPSLCKESSSPLLASLNIHAINQENPGIHCRSSNLDNDANCVSYNVHKAEHDTEFAENLNVLTIDKIHTDLMQPTKETEMHDRCGSEDKNTIERYSKTSSHCNQSKFDNKFEITLNEAREGLEENLGKEIVAYTGDMTPEGDIANVSFHQKQLQIEPFEQTLASERFVVQGLMASPNCPWRQGKSSFKPSPACGPSERKVKKRDFRQLEKAESILSEDGAKERHRKSSKKKSTVKGNATNADMLQLAIVGNTDVDASNNENDNFHGGYYRSCNTDVSLIPFSQINESRDDHCSDSKGIRTKVRETLRLFQAVCRKLLQEEEARKKVKGSASRRVDNIAAKILKDKGKCVNEGKQILGPVPGVDIGDEFRYRMELIIIGLHRQTQGGIDYVKCGRKILATSIVASGGYTNNLDSSDVLIYTGQGGNMINSDKEPEDQKLERGNLALKTSFDEKSPVRVIRGSDSSDGRTYVYDGLYLVEKWWQDMGRHGKLVFKFQLRRIAGQPELAWKKLKKSKKSFEREGLCVADISEGKESIPICAVNTIDDEKPPPFKYITKMIYPDWCRPIPLKGCDCTDGCSDSERCYCAVLNGGEIPFNFNGAIVEAKSLVYECGPSCKCLPSCHNRVSQHGIKFQLEIFKTESRGWGVRSLNSIPSGSFICEYIGELLEDKEAEQRTGNDEYLFDIGNNYSDNALWDGLSTLLPDAQSNACNIIEDGGFTIDAAEYGNIGRFINHSCSPNLYAQNVLYDHEDKRIPHIMFFAAENIPPLQELSYHYNYMMDQVRDSNGSIKKKRCYCGSVECTGWMY